MNQPIKHIAICIANSDCLKPHQIKPMLRFWDNFNMKLYLDYIIKKAKNEAFRK